MAKKILLIGKKTLICQWCFEEPAIDGKTVCQSCLDAVNKENKENKNFDLDKWLDEPKPRCSKCVYELYCSKDKDNERKCPDYKRDAPDGGYYG